MLVAVVVLACVATGLAVALVAVRGELVRMARFLRVREDDGSARVTLRVRTPVLEELASAVNGQLEGAQAQRLSARRSGEAFRRGLSSLSHDIRTPLMGAKGRLGLAAREPDAPVRERHLTAAASRLDDVGALLDQLFSYARASDPDLVLRREPVEVLPTVERVLAGHFADFEAAGMEPVLDFEDVVCAFDVDRDAWGRIVENVVTNALRHGTGTRLVVGQRGDVLSFSNEVASPRDIDPERLFERFWQADAARGGAGSGIGLATVASLCERMGLRASARLDGAWLTVELARSDA